MNSDVCAYKPTDEELKKIQMIQLDMIKEVDRICRKCNIRYNLVGGTMLGAVRHKGYIPWDDDADIGFLREEYEKFRQACKTELNKKLYYFQDFRNTRGYRWGYGKLRRKGTEFVRLNQEKMPYKQGISIDIMPFDNVPDSFLGSRIHKFCCFLFRKTFWSVIGKDCADKKWLRMVYSILYCIPETKLKKMYMLFIRFSNRKATLRVRILTFPMPEGVWGYKREWYERLKNVQFENAQFPGPEDFDGYLTTKYGDYMKLPPIEKRKIHEISELNLGEKYN